MADFCFRMRFRMLTRLDISKDPTPIKLPYVTGAPVIFSNEPREFAADQWVVIVGCGYSSESEAQGVARKLKDAVLLAGLEGFAADLGQNKSTNQYSEELKTAIKETHGVELRGEIYGIEVYEEGNIQHLQTGGYASVHMEKREFEERLAKAAELPRLSKLQRTAAELINDSFFPMPHEAKFLLRISSIEALSSQKEHSKAFLDVIDGLAKLLPAMINDREIASQLEKLLKSDDARRQSVTQACLDKLRSRLDGERVENFVSSTTSEANICTTAKVAAYSMDQPKRPSNLREAF